MKVLKSILISILVLFLVVSAVLVIAIKKFDVNSYKTQITEKISTAIDREVTIGNIELNFSLQQGLSLDVLNLVIADDPDFSPEHFLRVGLIRANLDILALLKTKQLSITDVEFIKPQVNLVRKKNGLMNIPTPVSASHDNSARIYERFKNILSPEAEAADENQNTAAKKNVPFDFSHFVIQSLKIKQGKLQFTDQQEGATHKIVLEAIEGQLTNFSFGRTSPFGLSFQVFSDNPNVFFNGSLEIDGTSQEIHLTGVKIKTDLAKISFTRLFDSLPETKNMGLEDSMQGQLDATVDTLTAGATGLRTLTAHGQLADARVKIRSLLYPIENIDADFEATEKVITFKDLSLNVANGKVSAQGSVQDYLQNPQIALKAQIESLQLSEVAAIKQLPVEIVGKLFGHVEASGLGKNPDDLMHSLKGTALFELKEGQLRNVNILKQVLGKITIIPNLYEDVLSNLPDQYKDKLIRPNTILNKAVADAVFQNGTAQLQNAEIDADGFLIKTMGTMDLNSNMSFDMALYIPEDISQMMIKSVNALSSLVDEQKRVYIPFRRYQGPLMAFRLYPDLETIGKKVVASQGKSELQKAIYKALDIKEEGQNPDGKTDSSGQPAAEPQQKSKPEKVLIDSILNSILK